MKKSAQVKFAAAITKAADSVYLDAFLKRASEHGVQINSQDDLDNLLKTAAALRTVAEQVSPVVKQANSEFISTALDNLLKVDLSKL